MKIKNIKLKNFKFHHYLEFNVCENCLIYGENGSGKSSIYKALYSNLYYFKDKKIISNQVDVADKFTHRDFRSEDLKVEIGFSNNTSLNRLNNRVENSELIKNQIIYLCDEKVFRKIVSIDFYSLVENELIKHFSKLDNLLIYQKLEDKLRRVKEDRVPREILEERKELNSIFEKFFNELIPLDEINRIIKEELKEDFEIEFIIKESKILNKTFIRPQISIKVKNIDDKGDFKNHFNEAKLKLIYFALAKRYETESKLKLLVLDDFLTSLDMANRKLIIQYILENFEEYQKIILTHNIQFYNLIIRLLKMRDEVKDWDIKNIFIRSVDNSFEALIYNKETNYIKEAENYLKENKLNEAGIYLRKEFERVVDELRQKNEVGAKEKMGNIIEQIVKLDSTTDINIKKMQKVLKQTKFYQESLLHSTAHNDIDRELYTKELNGAIVILKQLNKFLNVLRD